MLKSLPIGLAQVKVGNTSESLLNKIRKIMYFCIDQNGKKADNPSIRLYVNKIENVKSHAKSKLVMISNF